MKVKDVVGKAENNDFVPNETYYGGTLPIDLSKLAGQFDREKVARDMYMSIEQLFYQWDDLSPKEQHYWLVKSDALITAIEKGEVFK